MPKGCEVIVVDGFSRTPNVKELAGKFPGCRYIGLPQHQGPTFARNIWGKTP